MKHHLFAITGLLASLTLTSCVGSGRSQAYTLASEGHFQAAKIAVEHGDGDKADIQQGTASYMQRTLSSDSFQKWQDDELKAGGEFGDSESIDFYSKRGDL
jgi:hypothetical protein